MIRKSLCLDHFYIGFTSDELTDLKTLTNVLSRCTFREVVSGKDNWQGVYLYSNLGSYFEMILGSEHYGLGIACSAYALQYVDSRKIRSELKNLPWRSGKRKWNSTWKVWFDWLSLKPLHGKKSAYQPLYAWIMHYRQNHSDDGKGMPPQANIDRFKRLCITAGEDFAEHIKYNAQWLPGTLDLNEKKASIILPNRDSGNFQIDIEFIKGQTRPQLKYLQMTLCPEIPLTLPSLRLFTLERSGDVLTLKKND